MDQNLIDRSTEQDKDYLSPLVCAYYAIGEHMPDLPELAHLDLHDPVALQAARAALAEALRLFTDMNKVFCEIERAQRVCDRGLH